MIAKLLAVGNDQVLLMTRGEVMTQAGYSVTTAQDLATFVQQYRPSDFDLVILCYILPEYQRQAIASLCPAA